MGRILPKFTRNKIKCPQEETANMRILTPWVKRLLWNSRNLSSNLTKSNAMKFTFLQHIYILKCIQTHTTHITQTSVRRTVWKDYLILFYFYFLVVATAYQRTVGLLKAPNDTMLPTYCTYSLIKRPNEVPLALRGFREFTKVICMLS